MSPFQEFLDAAGPETQNKEVTAHGVTKTFTFRRLSGFEIDKLRAVNGTLEAPTFRSKLIAASVSFEGQTFDEMDIRVLDDATQKALANAVIDVNGMGADAGKKAEKNSEKTSSDGGSSISA
jgi:hypothetical protein